MKEFNFYQPTKIHFGVGRVRELGKIVSKYGNTCLLVTTSYEEVPLRPLYDRVTNMLRDADIQVFHFDEVVPNPTIGSIEKAISIVNENDIPVIVPVGGGSSIDTAKAIALFYGAGEIDWPEVFSTYTDPFAEYAPLSQPPLPVVSVTTTSGTGSQLTQAMVISDPSRHEKNCIFHDRVFSQETIIDPELMLTLPATLTAVTGFDAFSHAFESYLNDYASPYTEMIALESMRIITNTLPQVLKEGRNLELRSNMAYADMLSGISLTNAAASIPHPLSEIIGGVSPGIPHGQCLAVVYPEYITFIYKEKIEKCARVARILEPALTNASDEEAAQELCRVMLDFLDTIGLNHTLSELGCTEEELGEMSENVLLEVLPWASRDVLFEMIKKRF